MYGPVSQFLLRVWFQLLWEKYGNEKKSWVRDWSPHEIQIQPSLFCTKWTLVCDGGPIDWSEKKYHIAIAGSLLISLLFHRSSHQGSLCWQFNFYKTRHAIIWIPKKGFSFCYYWPFIVTLLRVYVHKTYHSNIQWAPTGWRVLSGIFSSTLGIWPSIATYPLKTRTGTHNNTGSGHQMLEMVFMSCKVIQVRAST